MTNWKRLYTDASLMLAKYQDEVVPRLRKEIEELKKNQVKVRCKDCKYGEPSINAIGEPSCACNNSDIGFYEWLLSEDDFCSYGERKDND